MAGLADILAARGGEDEGEHGDMPDAEPHEMAEASVKAFFEAGAAGDFAAAAEHLSAAIEHCDSMGAEHEEPDGDEGHGILAIAMPKDHRK